MFNNLIESSSHRDELKRRGSYFLFTTATYLVLFAVAGVLSIYAYDARLEEPPIEIVMVSPLDYQPPAPTVERPDSTTTSQEFHHTRSTCAPDSDGQRQPTPGGAANNFSETKHKSSCAGEWHLRNW